MCEVILTELVICAIILTMHYGAIILGKAHSGVAILTLHYGAKILRNAHSGVAFFFIFLFFFHFLSPIYKNRFEQGYDG